MGIFLYGLATERAMASFDYQELEMQTVEFTSYRGEVTDSETKKPLVFATLSVEGTNISTVTNTEGNFY